MNGITISSVSFKASCCEVGCAYADSFSPASVHSDHLYRNFTQASCPHVSQGMCRWQRKQHSGPLSYLIPKPLTSGPITWSQATLAPHGGPGCRASGPLLG